MSIRKHIDFLRLKQQNNNKRNPIIPTISTLRIRRVNSTINPTRFPYNPINPPHHLYKQSNNRRSNRINTAKYQKWKSNLQLQTNPSKSADNNPRK